MSNDNDLRLLYGTMQADGSMEYRTNLTHKSRTEPVILRHDSRPVIPIIFIPGLMATRLKSKDLGKPIWDPPNTIWDGIKMLFNYAFKDAATRAQELRPDNVKVAQDLPANVELRKKYPESAPRRQEKGWGEVYASSYHPFMTAIEQALNQALYTREELPDKNIKETLRVPQLPEKLKTDPKEYGAMSGAAPLTPAEFDKAIGKYRYDVWGCGYNWLQSNTQSAAYVWKRIGEILTDGYPEGALNEQKRVILITHSMGGLVARSLYKEHEAKCKKEEEKRIFGVIHIAQPAAGAPATYRIMRAGDTGWVQIMSGRNAAETTGVLARAQGGLELLPFAKYNNGQPWLTCEEWPDHQAIPLDLPFKGTKSKGPDPYTDIYTNPEWYGLLPDQNLKLALEGAEATEANLKKVRNKFSVAIEHVRDFHASITGAYHPVTYAIWGKGENQKAVAGIHWEQREKVYMPSDGPMFDSSEYRDNGVGCVSEGKYDNILREIEVPGDSTVPYVSAQDQERPGTVYFTHGNGKGAHNGEHGWTHQDACSDNRVQWAAIYSIIKLVSEHCP